MAENNKDLQWITVNGKHIPIKPGENKKDAISKAFGEDRDNFDTDDDSIYKEEMSKAAEETARANTAKDDKGQNVKIKSKEDNDTINKLKRVSKILGWSEDEMEIKDNQLSIPSIGLSFTVNKDGSITESGEDGVENYKDIDSYVFNTLTEEEAKELNNNEEDKNDGKSEEQQSTDSDKLTEENKSDEPPVVNDKYEAYKEKGKSTWNQKLSKGDKIIFEAPDGKEVEAYIGGFWYDGKLQDNDTYEEGKDNHWHDFRGVNIVDKDGKNLGNINAFQIKKHETQGISPEFDNEIAKAFGYLGGNGRPNRKDGYDYIAEEFDYDNKVYHNLDEHAKYLEDRIKDLEASPFAKDNPAWAAERKKEYQSQLDFIRKNKNRLQKYVDDSNSTHRSRVTTRALNAIRNISDLKRQYKDGSLSIEDIKEFLDRE